jgi:dTMP kinase
VDRAAPPRRDRVLSAPTLARFVTLEGGEGVGKSTQIRALADALGGDGLEVVTTREPGGSVGAEAVRDLLVEGGAERWSAAAELFLLLAARLDHLERTIRPAVGRGAVVLCDRYWDSTRVYQALVGELGLADVDALHERWLAPFRPALTLVLDAPVETGLARARPGRFEAKGADFHRRVREGYLTLARAEPARLRVIDAARPVAAVTVDAVAAVRAHLAAAETS